MKRIGELIYLLVCVATAMIGYTIHGNVGWSIIDFIFAPIALVYWLVTHQVDLTVLQHTFGFFMK